MPQFYKWDCWWCNCFEAKAGWYYACFYCSCWLKKPNQVQRINPGQCKCGEWTGIGDHFLWFGYVCCAPDYIGQYSGKLTAIEKKRLKAEAKEANKNNSKNKDENNKGTDAEINRQDKM